MCDLRKNSVQVKTFSVPMEFYLGACELNPQEFIVKWAPKQRIVNEVKGQGYIRDLDVFLIHLKY